jgi:hypoxanthine phosphoribosyltransferase
LNETIAGRHVIVLEDIIETGGTMQGLLDELQKEHPASLRIASLFFKPECLKKDIKIDYIGKEIGKEFIVGYGLDYAGYGRNYPNIYVNEE